MKIWECRPHRFTAETGLIMHRFGMCRWQNIDTSAGGSVPVGPIYTTERAAFGDLDRYFLTEGWKIEA